MTKLLSFPLLMLLIIIGATSCGERMTEEQRSREKAMNEIRAAEKAIDEYLSMIEEQYTDLLESRIVELQKALDMLRYELRSYTKSENVEEKLEVLEDHKRLLHSKMEEFKSGCSEGCDDFSDRINNLFNEVDTHLALVDSLLLEY